MGAKWWAELQDLWDLTRAHYRASLLVYTKNPRAVWFSSAMQGFYYVAQFAFWLGIRSQPAGQALASEEQMLSFLITLSLVDNTYLFFLGPGSLRASDKIIRLELDSVLLQPRDALRMLAFLSPNFNFLPIAILSWVIFIVYGVTAHVPWDVQVVSFLASLIGVFILNSISFLFRLTSFWTRSIIQVRNANPSFKIMVRPYDSFSGAIRLVLLTVFPALFLTGVPAQILAGKFGFVWVFGAVAAAAASWFYVEKMWSAGVRSYARRAN
jgi:ABC-2 type transport system permease protein